VKRFAPKSIIDLGCGVGSFLEGAFLAGCRDLLGIEISYTQARKFLVNVIEPHIRYGDVTCDLHLDRKFDCCISFEVAEHILPNSSNNFVNNLTKYSNKHIIFTAAPPGRSGTGHIICRDKEFWINLIENRGLKKKKKTMKEIRAVWKSFNAPPYILHNLMIFQKRKA
jgi:cyclopropane fatty-acyl-phospholipid synthase-like methyltransferase